MSRQPRSPYTEWQTGWLCSIHGFDSVELQKRESDRVFGIGTSDKTNLKNKILERLPDTTTSNNK